MDPAPENRLDWDAAYRRGDTPWEKGAPAPPLIEFLDAERLPGRVLVPGCGLGHDARAIAAAGARQVVGIDVSPTAVAEAQAGANPDNVEFRMADFFGGGLGAFDAVFEHTFISALNADLRERYAPSLRRHLAPGGLYLAVFFMTPWDAHEVPEPPPWGITDDEIAAMFDVSFETLRTWLPGRHYPGREGREKMALMRRRG